MIKDLKDRDQLDEIFLVREKHVSVGKNGRPFMSLVLGDASGTIDARLWDNVETLARGFEAGEILKVKGQVQLFQNRRQLILHRLERMDSAAYNVDDFMPKGRFDAIDQFAQLREIARSIKNPALMQLTMDCIDDPEIKPLLLKAPAAKSIHHAWTGGLIEHILSIVKIMEFLAGHYNFLNRDLLLFGAIFHDLGKVWELSWEQGIGYTDRGRLIGHMEMACELVDRKSARILGFDAELRDLCKHIILSHHGKYEYGSPKRPKFLEAMVVAMVDDLDSKVATILSFIENERGGGDRWSRYNELFERYFLLDNLKEKF